MVENSDVDYQYKCLATLTSLGFSIAETSGRHSYYGDSIQSQATAIKANLKESASTSKYSSTIDLISEEIRNVETDCLARLPEKSVLERLAWRAKAGSAEVNPTSLNFFIPSCYEDIVLYDSDEADPELIIAVGCVNLVNQIDTGCVVC